MTRQEFWARFDAIRRDAEAQHALHREFYAQFVNEATIDFVARHWGQGLLASTDPYFNDTDDNIANRRNDGLLRQMPRAIKAADAGLTGFSLSDLCCIAKEAGRQYVERVRS